MFLYYLSKKDYETAGLIYNGQKPRRHDPKGPNNPGGEMFGVNWFRNESWEEFNGFCRKYSNVFEFIEAICNNLDYFININGYCLANCKVLWRNSVLNYCSCCGVLCT